MTAQENDADDHKQNKGWKPGRRDAFFLAFVAAVVVLLIIGTGERTTKPTPNDDTHRHSESRAACMECHGESGVKPQPPHHTKADQCFQCHVQPDNWVGAK